MASTASAMSLSNFQVITSSSVPFACILAYNQPISGCTSGDFIQGRSCSALCVRDIQRAQSTLASACAGVNAPDTVLGQAILGNLVNLLCPSVNQAAATEPELTAPTPQQFVTLTALSSPPSATPLIPTPVVTDGVPSASPPPPPPPPPQEATQIAGPPEQSGITGINPTQATGAQETDTPPLANFDTGPGGGSPFDVSAAVTSTSWQLIAPQIGPLLAASVLAYLLG